VLTNHYYKSGAPSSTDADDFFSPENRAKRRAAERERIADLEREWALTPAQQEAADRAVEERETAEWLAAGAPDMHAIWVAKREADRAAALAELNVIEKAYCTAIYAVDWTDETNELAEAIREIARDAWHQKYDKLWPKQARSNAKIQFDKDVAAGRIPFPAGSRERALKAELDNAIERLLRLQHARAVIELDELKQRLT
jgi:hypothetical protein